MGKRGTDRGSGGAINTSSVRFIPHSRVMRALTDQIRHFARNQAEAARILGISRQALWEKRKRFGLD